MKWLLIPSPVITWSNPRMYDGIPRVSRAEAMRVFRAHAQSWEAEGAGRAHRSEGYTMYREIREAPPHDWRSQVRVSIKSRTFRRYDIVRYGNTIQSFWTAPAWMFKPVYGASNLSSRDWLTEVRRLIEGHFSDRTTPYEQASASIRGHFDTTITVTQHVKDGTLEAYQVESNWGEVLWTKSLEDVMWASAEALYTGTMNEWNGRVRYNEAEEEPAADDPDVAAEAEAQADAVAPPTITTTEFANGAPSGDTVRRLASQLANMPPPHLTISFNPAVFENGSRAWSVGVRPSIEGEFIDESPAQESAPTNTIFGYPVREVDNIMHWSRTPRGRQNFDGVVRHDHDRHTLDTMSYAERRAIQDAIERARYEQNPVPPPTVSIHEDNVITIERFNAMIDRLLRRDRNR